MLLTGADDFPAGAGAAGSPMDVAWPEAGASGATIAPLPAQASLAKKAAAASAIAAVSSKTGSRRGFGGKASASSGRSGGGLLSPPSYPPSTSSLFGAAGLAGGGPLDGVSSPSAGRSGKRSLSHSLHSQEAHVGLPPSPNRTRLATSVAAGTAFGSGLGGSDRRGKSASVGRRTPANVDSGEDMQHETLGTLGGLTMGYTDGKMVLQHPGDMPMPGRQSRSCSMM